ncbi:hypothetical protein [Fusibacter ferrireducens]|uniref:Uncharacterized protein n=1 Tax=Fusibacter ferrireducens TaxID=2785058 RepID=A0ABR9ZWV6_9FIRM|nr:hypothetical protein [Fusibacter ferrireducens]MBF4694934.1 hypothetical protein [Fusibacter ferrireducens]
MTKLLLEFMGSLVKPVSGKQIANFFNSHGYNYHQTGGTVGNAVKIGLINVVSIKHINGCRVNYFI